MNHPLLSRGLAVGALLGCLLALAAGADALPMPPSQPHELVRWWTHTDPALALGALLRVLAFALCLWLLVLTTVELLATATGWRALAEVARRAAPAAWRVLVLRPIAAGTLAVPLLMPLSGIAPAVAAADAPDVIDASDASDGPVMLTMTLEAQHDQGLDGVADVSTPPPTTDVGQTTTTTPVAPTTTINAPTPTPTVVVTIPEDLQDHEMAQIPDPSLPVPSPGGASPTAPSAPVAGTPEWSPAPSTADIYVVVPGDSFWRIAAVRVEVRLGRRPSPTEIATYWRKLIGVNEDRLAVPGNADLIFPGDELLLPPV